MITYQVDQIIAGVVINLFVLGLTSYVSSRLRRVPLAHQQRLPRFQDPRSDIPLIGPMPFNQNLFVYGALVLVTLSTYYLFHAAPRAACRAVGEHPRAADTLGIDVIRTFATRMWSLPAWWPAPAVPGSHRLGRQV